MNREKKAFVILGADNVGKTTMMNKSMLFAENVLNKKTGFVHFSAPKRDDPYTLYQYDKKRREELTNMVVHDEVEYLFLDRAWPESKFYELNRRGNHIEFEECFRCEKEYLGFAQEHGFDISINVMFKPWSFVEKFHIQELENNREFVEASALANDESTDLEMRRLEHDKYYRFMVDYCDTRNHMVPGIAQNMPWNVLSVTDLNFILV